MKKVNTVFKLVALAVMVSFVSSCAYSAKIIDTTKVYNLPIIQGAPKIILADFTDNRANKKQLGRVGALNLTSQTAINIVLTNRIASRLREKGFNVQKANLSKTMDKTEIREVLKYNNGNAFLSGGLDKFFIASFDAVMEAAKGITSFYVKIFDKDGNAIFNKTYSGYAENWIGLTGQFGCQKLIEKSIQASIEELFGDLEFRDLLTEINK